MSLRLAAGLTGAGGAGGAIATGAVGTLVVDAIEMPELTVDGATSGGGT